MQVRNQKKFKKKKNKKNNKKSSKFKIADINIYYFYKRYKYIISKYKYKV